jgi:hypothetical protein
VTDVNSNYLGKTRGILRIKNACICLSLSTNIPFLAFLWKLLDVDWVRLSTIMYNDFRMFSVFGQNCTFLSPCNLHGRLFVAGVGSGLFFSPYITTKVRHFTVKSYQISLEVIWIIQKCFWLFFLTETWPLGCLNPINSK